MPKMSVTYIQSIAYLYSYIYSTRISIDRKRHIGSVPLDVCDRNALLACSAEERPQLPALEPLLHSPRRAFPVPRGHRAHHSGTELLVQSNNEMETIEV